MGNEYNSLGVNTIKTNLLSNIKLNFKIKLKNRISAGYILGNILTKYKNNKRIKIIGIPKGGIVIADIIANKLDYVFFGIIIVQRLRSPLDSERTIGSIDQRNNIYLNPNSYNISKELLEKEIEFQKRELQLKFNRYKDYACAYFYNEDVILVDDGSNTGSTLIAAAKNIKQESPRKLIVAVPIIPKQTLEILKNEADKIEYILKPNKVNTVGEYYTDFRDVEDEDIIAILRKRSVSRK